MATKCLIGLDSTKQVVVYPIQTGQIEGQLDNDTSHYKVYLNTPW